MPNQDSCRSCGEPMLWKTNTASGKKVPLDAEPNSAGRIILEGKGECRYLRPGETYVGETYVSHFTTCQDSEQWRRGDLKRDGGRT